MSHAVVRILKHRRAQLDGLAAQMGKTRYPFRILVFMGTPPTKCPLRRPRNRQKDNMKMDLGVTDCEDGRGCNWLRIVPIASFNEDSDLPSISKCLPLVPTFILGNQHLLCVLQSWFQFPSIQQQVVKTTLC
jgi:hypothetical protein